MKLGRGVRLKTIGGELCLLLSTPVLAVAYVTQTTFDSLTAFYWTFPVWPALVPPSPSLKVPTQEKKSLPNLYGCICAPYLTYGSLQRFLVVG